MDQSSSSALAHSREVAAGSRFQFGENWARFLASVDETRIAAAMAALQQTLALDTFNGLTFLDVGSGSGLSSLAAHRLGAAVHSFDFDPDSVRCTAALKERFAPGARTWTIEQGSALDPVYVRRLGRYDIVHSWGVLHHTGRMWDGLAIAADAVSAGGRLFIALYNAQGARSSYWKLVKRIYNSSRIGRWSMLAVHLPYPYAASLVWRLITGRLGRQSRRGMTYWYDYVDWIGGLPFEVARPADVSSFLAQRGFRQINSILTRRSGCNEFVFLRERETPTACAE
jgi:2-polyprenyl-6-hydroxyphenyl methylase/3-demethylubiquinone-9 3-methyltransferase